MYARINITTCKWCWWGCIYILWFFLLRLFDWILNGQVHWTVLANTNKKITWTYVYISFNFERNNVIMTTSILYFGVSLKYFNRFLLTFDDSWLDKLITCSRASHNSRFKRRTSLTWRSSAEPYNDEPPDINDAALPCTVSNMRKKEKKKK